MNFLLKSNIHFEIAVVPYGKQSGTDAVRITKEEALKNMPGLGPHTSRAVIGRHGGTFNNFGDYSVSPFKNIRFNGDPPSRALFDMAAVAIVKNPEWADSVSIPCPIMVGNEWIQQPNNLRKIVLWKNFQKKRIITDFLTTLRNYVLVNPGHKGRAY